MAVLLVVLLLLLVGAGFLLWVAARRMMEYEDLLQEVHDTLEDYSVDLRGFLSGEVLVDHPEVVSFHRRNQRALEEISSLVEDLPRRRRAQPPPLPRPLVE